MKKIVLKKTTTEGVRKRIGYKIDYSGELNTQQYEAVMHTDGAALVIAGAGTGKTRTLIYRLARLIEDGIEPESVLLLTFTRKAASEMLRRAAGLLDGRCEKVSGGTFHSFAMLILRRYSEAAGFAGTFNVLDQTDSEDSINLIRSRYKLEKGKRRFPQKSTLHRILSLSVNKRMTIEEILQKEYPFFTDEAEKIIAILDEYNAFKKKSNLMDYDDLLLNLLNLLKSNQTVLKEINGIYKYVMVDEYQDTNRLQHEIVLQLAGAKENVVAVGDDAQSIYAFRGADFQNIMFFPESFSSCKIFKIEENYRSTQPVLNLTNAIMERAVYKYQKELFTRITGGEPPKLVVAETERQQSEFITQHIMQLREEGIPLEEIAVLFRSTFLSFDLEIELNKSNIPYKKFGGMKFIETAHIKDLISYLRIIYNPLDAVSWQRALLLLDGIGPGAASKIIDMVMQGEISFGKFDAISQIKRNTEGLTELFSTLTELSSRRYTVSEKAASLSEFYKPLLTNRYDDWQKRWKDIEMFRTIAARYETLNTFLSDMAIDPPLESLSELTPESKEEEFLTLSTIHSAKGLEWKAVFILWALEGRFPSAKAVESIDTLEEERRLFYVAATRAKTELIISFPTNIYDRESGFVLSKPTRFLDGIGDDLIDKYLLTEEE